MKTPIKLLSAVAAAFTLLAPFTSSAAVIKAYNYSSDMQYSPQLSYAAPSTVGTVATVGTTSADGDGVSDKSIYDGEGTVIAILDTSFNVGHEIFCLDDGVSTAISKADIEAFYPDSEAYNHYYGFNFEYTDVYVSPKIPFAYDYSDNDVDLSSTETHGMGVASIAAGNDAKALKNSKTDDADVSASDGIAPNAQLLLMKIFDDKGHYYSDEATAAAIYDSIALGADVINFSMGTAVAEEHIGKSTVLEKAIAAAVEAGIVVTASAGNDNRQGVGSVYDEAYGITRPLTSNPDSGLVAHPGTLQEVLSVAAAENEVAYASYIYSSSNDAIDTTPATNSNGTPCKPELFDKYAGRTFKLVEVPNLGEDADYEGLDVAGKAVLVNRGVIYFSEKIKIAASHGAAVVIIRDNTDDGSLTMLIEEEITVPAVFISKADGEKLLSDKDNLTVRVGKTDGDIVENKNAGKPSAYSAWGPTASLRIKPEIMAVGGDIRAASNESDSSYDVVRGTSMSSPAVAGAVASLKGALVASGYIFGGDDDGSELYVSDSDTAAFLKARLMSGASPSTDDSGVMYSPRKQGAGLVNVANATADVYLSADESGLCAKIEPGELVVIDNSGTMLPVTFDIFVHNASSGERSVKLSGSVLTSDYDEVKTDAGKAYFQKDTERALNKSTLTVGGGKDNLNIFADSHDTFSVTLSPYETRKVTFTLTMSREEYSELKSRFAYGFFLEGYVFAETSDGESNDMQSLPFMGFVGDFDTLPLFDASFYTSSSPFYPDSGIVTSENEDGLYSNGMYRGKYYSELIVFSPNNDGNADYGYLYVNPLRNFDGLSVKSAYGENDIFEYDSYLGFIQKAIASNDTEKTGWYVLLCDGTDTLNDRWHMSDGRYTAITTAVRGDFEQTLELPFYIDTSAPSLEYYAFRKDNGKLYLDITLSDTHYVKWVRVYTTKIGVGEEVFLYGKDAVDTEDYYTSHILKYVPFVSGEHDATLSFDITDFDGEKLYIDVCDYGFNEASYRILRDN